MNKRRVKPEHVRREEIVNAAYDVIFEVGLSNTTMAQIAKKPNSRWVSSVITLATNRVSLTLVC